MPQKLLRALLFSFLICHVLPAGSQGDDYAWWNNKHHWDGITNWQYYLKYAPAYFGPNALPVPEIRTARSDSSIMFESSFDMHFGRGDKTQNIFIRLSYPFWDGRIRLELFGVPVEHFVMDTLTRDERVVRDYDARGFAAGDLYISTLIQLLRDRKSWPDIMLGITLRTASGGNLGNARYTDAPGYYFDLSAGKNFPLSRNFQFRPYAMLGFYVYQTNRDDWRQNDAFLYGMGLSAISPQWEFSAKWGGYKGYFNDGDAPAVIRASALFKFNKLQLSLSFQQGLNDFEYSSVRIGSVLLF